MTSPFRSGQHFVPGRELRRVLALCVLVGACIAVWGLRCDKHPGEEPAKVVADDDPRLSFATPYDNVRPDVKYVGSAVCAECHADKAATYQQHPMGRSMAAIAPLLGHEDYGPATQNPFTKFGLDFLVERHDARVLHAAIQRDGEGRELYRQVRPVSFVVGSGTRGRAYLVEQDGRLEQSPINWFSQRQRWDLAPNASGSRHNDFFRPITPQCIYCHADRAEPIETSVNLYHTPVFASGPAIGCERCHGPGELHSARQAGHPAAGSQDNTIVNPRRLEPALREAVCQQCHLQGEARLERRGRNTFDYRPGLPLDLFWSVFVRTPAPDDQQLVGQVEQMVSSQCYRRSDAALGCISCHDPHALPARTDRVAYYRHRCVACHEVLPSGAVVTGAANHAPLTPRHSPEDDCIACHMPRMTPTDVAHTAITDHRIVRRPGKPTRDGSSVRRPLLREVALASFYGGSSSDQELLRDLGIALLEARTPRQERQALGQIALPGLEASLRTAPGDVRALLAKGEGLRAIGLPHQALATFEGILDLVPQHEPTLRSAAAVADGLGRVDDALAYWQRALILDPRSCDVHFGLAKLWAGQQRWQKAIAECRATLELAPAHLEARMILVQCALQSRQQAIARTEIKTLLASDFPQKEALRRLLAELDRQKDATRDAN